MTEKTENQNVPNQDEDAIRIMYIKLTTGEEIITKVSELTSNCESAIQIISMPDGEGKMRISFLPYMQHAENRIFLLNQQQVVAISSVDAQMLRNYLIYIGDIPDIAVPETKIFTGK